MEASFHTEGTAEMEKEIISNHPALRVSARGLEQRVNKQSPQSRFAVSEKTAIERKCWGSEGLEQ